MGTLSPRSLVIALVLAAVVAAPFAPQASVAGHAPASEVGAWDPQLIDGEVPAINMAVTRDGSVLYWSGLDARGTDLTFFIDAPLNGLSRVLSFGEDGEPVVTTPTPEKGPGPSDMFCSGQTVLADGTVLVVGGTERYKVFPELADVLGTNASRLFDPDTETWALSEPMLWWRWYPTVLGLPDGTALVASGIFDLANPATHVAALERFDPGTGTWNVLPESADNLLPLYPRLHVVGGGDRAGDVVFTGNGCMWCFFGEHPEEGRWSLAQALDLEAEGGPAWEDLGPMVFGARQMGVSVPLALRPPYAEAEFLVAGGTLQRSGAATPSAEILDVSDEQSAVSAISPMHTPRWHPNAVLLPTGEVFVVGGGLHDDILLPGKPTPILTAEVLDPEAVDPVTGLRGAWTETDPMQVGRVYHGTAVLLPDARVLVGGHVSEPNPFTHDVVEEQTFETRFEVYEPGYLHRGARPEIVALSDDSLAYGQPFLVSTDDDGAIDQVVLVRPAAVTHAYDNDQRLVELAAEAGDEGIAVLTPPDANVAPPGWYMLFVLTGDGTPSVAEWVHLG